MSQNEHASQKVSEAAAILNSTQAILVTQSNISSNEATFLCELLDFDIWDDLVVPALLRIARHYRVGLHVCQTWRYPEGRGEEREVIRPICILFHSESILTQLPVVMLQLKHELNKPIQPVPVSLFKGQPEELREENSAMKKKPQKGQVANKGRQQEANNRGKDLPPVPITRAVVNPPPSGVIVPIQDTWVRRAKPGPEDAGAVVARPTEVGI